MGRTFGWRRRRLRDVEDDELQIELLPREQNSHDAASRPASRKRVFIMVVLGFVASVFLLVSWLVTRLTVLVV